MNGCRVDWGMSLNTSSLSSCASCCISSEVLFCWMDDGVSRKRIEPIASVCEVLRTEEDVMLRFDEEAGACAGGRGKGTTGVSFSVLTVDDSDLTCSSSMAM